jgi:hypothetical protein
MGYSFSAEAQPPRRRPLLAVRRAFFTSSTPKISEKKIEDTDHQVWYPTLHDYFKKF